MPVRDGAEAGRRADDPRRHDRRGHEHRRRGPPGDGRRARAGDRGEARRHRRHRDADRRGAAGARHRRSPACSATTRRSSIRSKRAPSGPTSRSGSSRSSSATASELDSDIADIKNLGGDVRGRDHGRAVPRGVRGRIAVGAYRHRGHHAVGRRRLLAVEGRDRFRHAPPHRVRLGVRTGALSVRAAVLPEGAAAPSRPRARSGRASTAR